MRDIDIRSLSVGLSVRPCVSLSVRCCTGIVSKLETAMCIIKIFSLSGGVLILVFLYPDAITKSQEQHPQPRVKYTHSRTHCCAWPARAVATSTTNDPAPMTTASQLCTRDPLPPVVFQVFQVKYKSRKFCSSGYTTICSNTNSMPNKHNVQSRCNSYPKIVAMS